MVAIWAISHLCVVSEADLSIKADTWITTSTSSQLGSALRLPWNGLNAGAVKLKCFPQQAETFRKCFHLKFSVCQLRETKNIKYLVLDVRGRSLSADCFCHKYRKAIHEWGHNQTRPIFHIWGRDIRFTFPDVISDLVTDWKSFHWHWHTPYMEKNQHTCCNQSLSTKSYRLLFFFAPALSFQIKCLWLHILKLDWVES